MSFFPYKRAGCSSYSCGKHTTCSLHHRGRYNGVGQDQYRGLCQKCGYTPNPYRLTKSRAEYIPRRGSEEYSATPRVHERNEIHTGICEVQQVQDELESEVGNECHCVDRCGWQKATPNTVCLQRQPPLCIQQSQDRRPAALYDNGNVAGPCYSRKNPGCLSRETLTEGDPRKSPSDTASDSRYPSGKESAQCTDEERENCLNCEICGICFHLHVRPQYNIHILACPHVPHTDNLYLPNCVASNKTYGKKRRTEGDRRTEYHQDAKTQTDSLVIKEGSMERVVKVESQPPPVYVQMLDSIPPLSALGENIQPYANEVMLSSSTKPAPKRRNGDLDDMILSQKVSAHEPVLGLAKKEKTRDHADDDVDCENEYRSGCWRCNTDDVDNDNPPHNSAQGCCDSNISLAIPAVVAQSVEDSFDGVCLAVDDAVANTGEERGESVFNNLSLPTTECAYFGESWLIQYNNTDPIF